MKAQDRLFAYIVIGLFLAGIYVRPPSINAGLVVKPYNFPSQATPPYTILSAEVNSDFDTLYDVVNANLDNDNIKAGAGIVYSKLNLSNGIMNADVNTSAAIAYSKLALTGSVVVADFASSVYGGTGSATTISRSDHNQYAYASAAQVTTDISTTDTSYGNMDGMTITFTATGKPVFMLFSAEISSVTDGGQIRLTIDGDQKTATSFSNSASGTPTTVGSEMLAWLETLAAGSHTITVQWKSTTGNTISQTGSSYPRVLIVNEL